MERIVSVHDLFRPQVSESGHRRRVLADGEERRCSTRKQAELLRFIHERLKEAGVPPSFDEMKDALDLRSKSGIHRLITALEERGFIRRLPNRARAIEVIKLPESVAHGMSAAARAASPRASSKAISAACAPPPRTKAAGRSPCRSWAASPPARRSRRSRPAATPSTCRPTCSRTGEHFALEVRGDSMIEAGILDGDMALIKRTDAADTGDIVVALIDDEEATLKRFRRRGASIALEAGQPRLRGAHPAAQPGAHPGQAGRTFPEVLSDPNSSPDERSDIRVSIPEITAMPSACRFAHAGDSVTPLKLVPSVFWSAEFRPRPAPARDQQHQYRRDHVAGGADKDRHRVTAAHVESETRGARTDQGADAGAGIETPMMPETLRPPK